MSLSLDEQNIYLTRLWNYIRSDSITFRIVISFILIIVSIIFIKIKIIDFTSGILMILGMPFFSHILGLLMFFPSANKYLIDEYIRDKSEIDPIISAEKERIDKFIGDNFTSFFFKNQTSGINDDDVPHLPSDEEKSIRDKMLIIQMEAFHYANLRANNFRSRLKRAGVVALPLSIILVAILGFLSNILSINLASIFFIILSIDLFLLAFSILLNIYA